MSSVAISHKEVGTYYYKYNSLLYIVNFFPLVMAIKRREIRFPNKVASIYSFLLLLAIRADRLPAGVKTVPSASEGTNRFFSGVDGPIWSTLVGDGMLSFSTFTSSLKIVGTFNALMSAGSCFDELQVEFTHTEYSDNAKMNKNPSNEVCSNCTKMENGDVR